MEAARPLEQTYSYRDLDRNAVRSTGSKRQTSASALPSIMAIGLLLVLFTILTLLVYRYAVISETKYAIFALNKDIKELNMKKDELLYELDTTVALDNVEKIGVEQLGMSYPNQGQMIYIKASTGYNLAVAEVFQGIPENTQQKDLVDHIATFAARFRR